jgi:hypothetical protein
VSYHATDALVGIAGGVVGITVTVLFRVSGIVLNTTMADGTLQ